MKKNADPARMCSACRQKKPKSALWRIVVGSGGAFWDPSGKADGRGLYVCRDENCLRSLSRRKNCQKQVGAQTLQDICGRLLAEMSSHV